MQVYYLFDPERKAMLNAAGKDYTPAYIPEILSMLGVTAQPIGPQALIEGVLKASDILLTGSEALPRGMRASCVHIAFASEGELTAFGLEGPGIRPQTDDPYRIDGYYEFELAGRQLPLPVLGGFAAVKPQEAEICGYAQVDGQKLAAFFSWGDTYYFAFDLPGIIWYAGDGRPLTEGKHGFALGRVPDGRVVPLSYDTRIAFSDYYAYMLQTILARYGVPMIHRLPPVAEGQTADLLIYFAGDDDAYSAENNIKAAEAMKARGLPYHINVMPKNREGEFVLDREQQEALMRGGCEIAIHFDFTADLKSRFPYSEAGYRMQAEMFERTFGRKTYTAVNHCLIQKGSCADRLRYEQQLGIRGNNDKIGEVDESDVNAFNMWGYAFGTSFPRFTLDDAAHDNAHLDIVEIPSTYYEPRLHGDNPQELAKLHNYLDCCVFWGRTGGLFFHPHYISGVVVPAEPALAALDACMAYCEEKGYQAVKTAPDALTRWWHERAASRILEVTPEGFILESAAEALSLRLPEGAGVVYVDSVRVDVERKALEGTVCKLLTVKGRGRHTVRYEKA